MPLRSDLGRGHPWGDGYQEQFNRFRQGHIIEGVPLVYLGSATHPLWAVESEVLRDGFGRELQTSMEKGLPLRHAMITTQGCDILKPTHTWIGVTPVYDAAEYFDRGKIGQIGAGQILYLLAIAPPWATSDQKWVADLRIEIPLEKTVLLGREPLEAYANDADYVRVPQRLAFLRQRPDVANACLDYVSQPLFDWVRQQDERERERMWATVDHVRIWQDSYESPTKAQLILVVHGGRMEDHDHDLWDAAQDHVYEQASAAGLMMIPTKVTTMEELSAAEFQASFIVEDGSSS